MLQLQQFHHILWNRLVKVTDFVFSHLLTTYDLEEKISTYIFLNILCQISVMKQYIYFSWNILMGNIIFILPFVYPTHHLGDAKCITVLKQLPQDPNLCSFPEFSISLWIN
jgi:hypothetical protein